MLRWLLVGRDDVDLGVIEKRPHVWDELEHQTRAYLGEPYERIRIVPPEELAAREAARQALFAEREARAARMGRPKARVLRRFA
jgi:hypothetical protein